MSTNIADILDTLASVRDYLADHSDADHNGVKYVPNKAMRLMMDLDEAIAKLRRRQHLESLLLRLASESEKEHNCRGSECVLCYLIGQAKEIL